MLLMTQPRLVFFLVFAPSSVRRGGAGRRTETSLLPAGLDRGDHAPTQTTMMVPLATVSLMASRALSRCAMHHIASRHAVVGIGQRMASSPRFAPLTFLLHSLSSSSSSPPSSSRGGLARFFSGSRPPPSGPAARSKKSRTSHTSVIASGATPRKAKKQLDKLNEEIDAVVTEIRKKEAERKTETNGTEKGVLLKSIDILNEALKDLRATRGKLIDASIAASVPSPAGKSTPSMNVVPCDVDAPPLNVCAGLTHIRPLLSSVTTPPFASPLHPPAATHGKNRPFIAVPIAPTFKYVSCVGSWYVRAKSVSRLGERLLVVLWSSRCGVCGCASVCL